jgi:hypothetical protein
MDNPQHYQPLSHALHPPLAHKLQAKSAYSMYDPSTNLVSTGNHREEEEEDEEDDDDEEDEGFVEEQPHESETSGVQMGGNLPSREDRSTRYAYVLYR